MYASNTELAYLCRVLATEYPGAYYAPHHRSYGHKAMESYEEMLNLARNTNCPVRECQCGARHDYWLTEVRSHTCYTQLS